MLKNDMYIFKARPMKDLNAWKKAWTHVVRWGIARRILERTEFDQTCAKTLVKQSGIFYTWSGPITPTEACASRRVCCSWWQRKQGKDFSWHCYMCCSTSKDSSWLVLKEEFCRLVNCSFSLNYSWHYVWPLFDFVCGVDTRRSRFLGVSLYILHQNEWFERCPQKLTTGI